MITIAIHQSRSYETCDAIIQHVFSKYSLPEYMIMDQDGVFMSTLTYYLFKKLSITMKTVASIKIIKIVSQVLGYPHRLGSASRVLGLRWWTETKAIVGNE